MSLLMQNIQLEIGDVSFRKCDVQFRTCGIQFGTRIKQGEYSFVVVKTANSLLPEVQATQACTRNFEIDSHSQLYVDELKLWRV